MQPRTIEDRLREEYFGLLQEMHRTVEEVDATVKHLLLPVSRRLEQHERVVVKSRVKSCESAIEKLRRQQPGKAFDSDQNYSLRVLKDLAGVRVLAFPRALLPEIDTVLRGGLFGAWMSDPFVEGSELGFKYFGYCRDGDKIQGEYQIVPLLVGLFWEVEHSAIYKPAPNLIGIAREPDMRLRTDTVLESLQEFENTFMYFIKKAQED